MDGGEWTVFLLIIGLLLAGGVAAAIWVLRVAWPWVLALLPTSRQLAYNAPAPPAPRIRRTSRPQAATPFPARYRRRDALIAAGLAAGMTPAQIADAWAYTPRSTRRRVAVVQERLRTEAASHA